MLVEQLGLKRGDRFQLGTIEVEIRALIRSEPDKITGRLAFGPRVMVSVDTLLASGLADIGSLAKWRYAVRLPDAERSSASNLTMAAAEVRNALPQAGFSILDRRNPAPRVTQVLWPGLPEHPGHEIAARQMRDFGGMVSFLVETEEEAVELVSQTKVWTLAESLGGVESLIEHPARMTHASTAAGPFAAPRNLVRLSVGLEAADDLVEDLERALAAAPARA